ncbi:MAG: patatin-like phospholipase family protein [Gammaproteobacteria bacterium]
MTRRALVIGCGGVAGGAWTIAMLDSLSRATGWDPRTADILMGTSSGSVIVSLLGGGTSVERLLDNQRTGLSRSTAWDHNRSSGGALPPLPSGPLPGAPGLVWQGLRGRASAMTALSGLLPKGRLDISPLQQLISTVATSNDWVAHPATWVVAVDDRTAERVAFGAPGAPRARLQDAVCASCAIPGWAPPIRIGQARYLDGGIASPTSADLLVDSDVDEVIIITPMASRQLDRPATLAHRVERMMRKVMTDRVTSEIARLERNGKRVLWLDPSPEDLQAFGYNMMDPGRRQQVLDTALRTTPLTVENALRITPVYA